MINVDEVGIKALTTAIGVLGPRIVAAATKPRGRRADDLSIARWFETYRITAEFPDLPDLSPPLAEGLADLLRGDDTQAALQELLAARLTDADEAEAARAREVFCLTLSTADPAVSQFGPPLAEFYDDQICSLVARLEAAEPAMLAQIRSEAMSARMIAILRAIERHTAALTARPNSRTEASFLASYRSHVLDQHGKLEPPDFDRRRRVPISDIYVPPVISEDTPPGRTVVSVQDNPPALTVWDLAGRLDRSVLLGDPGGGKTTTSTVLMHHFASGPERRVPLLVTLRNYAAEDPPKRSVVGFIEHELKTLYRCPAPPGLVDMLLLTGRAVVIFDGLDELLDTSRRADVATRVEHFCGEYPLAPVLVTSRVVGYEQARLDDAQFTSFRLGNFRDEDVAAYARKWFALEDGAHQGEAYAFLAESNSVPDLRSNPLLLSLMCILYRGEGSLPRNRAEIYEQCANLLFRRWDARRRIHQDLRAGHLLEPALRHLAWWLFTRDNAQSAVTERELVTAATEFLHGRGFESEDAARDAAREFVTFCAGRMWVFSDAGTTATGEGLYSFTHRTFLEFFAAAQLAYDSDTPEKLARTLAPYVARGEWEIVAELAVQIKDSTSRDGAQRIYTELLGERRRRSVQGRSNILQFLARTLRSVDPTPTLIRHLAREVLDFMFSGDPDKPVFFLPVSWLLASCDTALEVVDAEVTAFIDTVVASNNHEARLNGLRLAMWLNLGPSRGDERGPELPHDHRLRIFWDARARENCTRYQQKITAAATKHIDIRDGAVRLGAVTAAQAINMKEGLLPFLRHQRVYIFGFGSWAAYLLNTFYDLASDPQRWEDIEVMTVVGQHLTRYPDPPWVTGETDQWYWIAGSDLQDRELPASITPVAFLGAAAIALMTTEATLAKTISELQGEAWRGLGPFSILYAYMTRRNTPGSRTPLPDLPVPEEFKQVFRDWAEGKVNFTGPTPESTADV
jgi:NACHT domain